MRFDFEHREITSNVVLDSRRCSMANNTKAFRISFGQIYPDIIKAIVREIISNGWDAQKVAGTLHRPIEVTPPSIFDRVFTVRDYGVGMDHEFVMDRYSVLYDSTKDDSDDEVGQNGIGSKTPLGYGDAFSLQCWDGSETRIYEILIESDGFPAVNLRFRAPDSSPKGVAISMAVKEEDVEKFNNEIEAFVKQFPTPIKVDGIERDISKPDFKGSNWSMYSGMDKSLYVRMGCVSYKVTMPEYDRTMKYCRSSPYSIVIDVPIGTFQVATSREDLIYNEASRAKITEFVGKVIEEYKAHVTEELKKFKTRIEAFRYSHNFPKPALFSTSPSTNIWRGTPLQRRCLYSNNYNLYRLESSWGSRGFKKKRIHSFYTSDFNDSEIALVIRTKRVDVLASIEKLINEENLIYRNLIFVDSSDLDYSKFGFKKIYVSMMPKKVYDLADYKSTTKRNPSKGKKEFFADKIWVNNVKGIENTRVSVSDLKAKRVYYAEKKFGKIHDKLVSAATNCPEELFEMGGMKYKNNSPIILVNASELVDIKKAMPKTKFIDLSKMLKYKYSKFKEKYSEYYSEKLVRLSPPYKMVIDRHEEFKDVMSKMNIISILNRYYETWKSNDNGLIEKKIQKYPLIAMLSNHYYLSQSQKSHIQEYIDFIDSKEVKESHDD